MPSTPRPARPVVVDLPQLQRIEALHRGFLYQHLYAVRCLLLAPGTDVQSVVVETDEDVEIVRRLRRTYVQVKSRSDTLRNGDIDEALGRFSSYRALHASGARPGQCGFVIATDADLAPSVSARLAAPDWPADVRIDTARGAATPDPIAVTPPASVGDAFSQCRELAGRIPFVSLAPETLVWKLAGVVMAAASALPPRTDHTFAAEELHDLFEQLVHQLQDFPAPPSVYRPQNDEPSLASEARIRLITGWSGAGKTAWAAQASIHATAAAAYVDVRDVPGAALSSTVARELAAKLYGASGGLGRVLLPGASGLEILQSVSRRMSAEGRHLIVVLDNAHAPPPADVAAVINAAPAFNFVVLAHPGAAAQQLATLLSAPNEALKGWSADTIAAEASSAGCRADVAACEALLALTGGLPLYVQNAVGLARDEYGGDVSSLCSALDGLAHSTETAQELILSRLVDSLPSDVGKALAILSLVETPLDRELFSEVVRSTLGLPMATVAAQMRRLRTIGVLEVYPPDRIKVHDSVRLLGRGQFVARGLERPAAVRHLREALARSVQESWEHAKVRQLIRLLADEGDAKTLVELAGDENFHELGLWPDIETALRVISTSAAADPDTRFWALDGIVFNLMRAGSAEARARIDDMKRLVSEHSLGAQERLAVGMKEMNLLAKEGREEDAVHLMAMVGSELGSDPERLRIFRYNAAAALMQLGKPEIAAKEAEAIATEYYAVLGVRPEDIVGLTQAELLALLKHPDNFTDCCKHLADCLDLFAMASNKAGRKAGLARIHALKFYSASNSLESVVRVGQDVADEFVYRHDFLGARAILEQHVLPVVREFKLAGYVVPVRSQYAVVLAYCKEFDAADAEMERLKPYEAALPADARAGLANQRRMIAELRLYGPPSQQSVLEPAPLPGVELPLGGQPRLGPNEACHCGSGRKYSRCHGR